MTAPADPKPREIAVLMALRREPLNDHFLRDRIGDEFTSQTIHLTSGMCRDGLIGKAYGTSQWRIAPAGRKWLREHDLDALPGALLWVEMEAP